MAEIDPADSARAVARLARGAARHRPVLACALLLAVPLPTSAQTSGAGPPPEIRRGDIVRSGCVVHMDEPDAAGIAEVTADCRWTVPHRRVAEIVANQDGIDEVMSSVSESRVLPDGRVLQVHTMGWGVTDRQVTLRIQTRELADGGLRVDFRLAQEQEPLPEGRLQILLDEGYWQIGSDGKGGTHLRYAVRYDPGGNLKPWVVRKFQTSGIAKSMEEVRAAAER